MNYYFYGWENAVVKPVVEDCCFDLTSEQFGDRAKELVYENNPEQFREVHFAKEEKRLRYERLKEALERL